MISIENVKLIEHDLQSAGIDYRPLQQELIDHICMDVQREIELGNSFDLAYQNIKFQYISNSNIIEVQNDTKNLLDFKSHFLKKILIVASGITFIGFLFKTFKITGSNWIQFLSIVILGIFFFKIGFYFFQDKRKPQIKKMYSVSLFVVGTFLFISYLIYSFFPDYQIVATRLNMLSYLLLSLSLTVYFSAPIELNIFGIADETSKTDLLIACFNLCLACLSLIFRFVNYTNGLKYLLFIIIGCNFLLAIIYLLIKQKFKNRLISLLIISAIVIHLYHLPFFIRGIFE